MRSVLFHVQHLLGIGHLQRSLCIAEALVEHGIAVTLVSGGPPTALPRHPAIEFRQLPPIRALDARFQLIDAAGSPVDDGLREARRSALLAIFAAARPDAVILEGYPFARRAFRFELDPLIAAVHAASPRPRLLCSLRDILVMRDDPERHRSIADRVHCDFDAVLVHGDPALIPLDASFPLAAEIAARLIYTGYVGPPGEPANDGDGAGEVIVSAGGGAAGGALLQSALTACRAGCLTDSRWRLIAGTNLPDDDFARLSTAAPDNAVVERFHQNLAALLRHCRVSVSQAGYNTVLDIVRARARAVLVPFAEARETEQSMRAERLAALGAVELLRESELSPGNLARAIERAAGRMPPRLTIDMDGARRSARVIAAMLASPGRDAQCIATAARMGIIGR
jgi:predicted glycosyltransferase